MILIDAQEYAKELANEMDWPGRHPEFISAIECAMADLSDMPHIEAEPVKHAKWEKVIRTDSDGYDTYWFRCSECYEDAPKNRYGHDYFSKRCPRCGSYMTSEGEGTDD